VRPNIRDEIRMKLWGNCSLNPISVLTHATLDVLCADPSITSVARAIMLDARTIAEKFGVKIPIDAEKRLDAAAAVGAHKT